MHSIDYKQVSFTKLQEIVVNPHIRDWSLLVQETVTERIEMGL